MVKEHSSGQLIYQIYLFLVLFAYTDGFGLRGDGMWGGLGNASLGPFGILQLLLFIISIYYMMISLRPLFRHPTKVSNATKWFLLLFVLIAVQLIIQSFFDVSKITKFSCFLKLKNWLLLFSIPVLYDKISIERIVNVVKLSGVVSAAIVIIVLTFHIQGTAIDMKVGSSVTHALRVMMPTGSLITLAFFLFISSFQRSKSLWDIAGVLLCFMGTFIQLHRSTTMTLLIVTALYFLFEFKFNILRTVLIVAGGFVALTLLFNVVGYSFEMLGDVFSTTRTNVSVGEDAGTSMRIGMMVNAMSYVTSNYLILGIGLDWIRIEDPDMYNYLQFAATPTLDNGYFNIIIVFGLLGLVIFLNMLLKLFLSALRSKRRCDVNSPLSVMATGVFYYFIYTIMASLGGDRFFFDLVFPITLGIILMNEKMINYYSQKELFV